MLLCWKTQEQPLLGTLKGCPEETPYCVNGVINAWNTKAEAP